MADMATETSTATESGQDLRVEDKIKQPRELFAAVDPYLRVFGQPGLHVMDGSVMPANPGVNPSLTIMALVERAMSLWPNKTDPDTRPPLGSGYERINPIMPRRPVVPAGAPGELRLDAKQSDVIPEYPY
jgi:cholesterol oxidase